MHIILRRTVLCTIGIMENVAHFAMQKFLGRPKPLFEASSADE